MSVAEQAGGSRKTVRRVKRLGKYELLARIGVGGMAEVYLARQRGPMNFEKVVVVKTIHPNLASEKKFMDMLLDEARIAALIKHPRVVDIYDLGEADGKYFIAMEYLVGQPLTRVIKTGRQGQPLDVLSTAQLIADAADGLHAAHELVSPAGKPLDLVHRDVTPGNIFVLYDGNVKLLDFGVSKAEGERFAETQVGKLKGKIGYLAPEQIAHDDVDRRSDIFTLGVVLWESLALGRLFRANNPVELMELMLEWEPEPPSYFRSGVSQELDEICLRALALDPNKRFQTAREMRVALLQMLRAEDYRPEQDLIGRYMSKTFGGHRDQQQNLLQALADGTRELTMDELEGLRTDVEAAAELATPASASPGPHEGSPLASDDKPTPGLSATAPSPKPPAAAKPGAAAAKPTTAPSTGSRGSAGGKRGIKTRASRASTSPPRPRPATAPPRPRPATAAPSIPPITEADTDRTASPAANESAASSSPAPLAGGRKLGPLPGSDEAERSHRGSGPPLPSSRGVVAGPRPSAASETEPSPPESKPGARTPDPTSEKEEREDLATAIESFRAWPAWVRPAIIGGAIVLLAVIITIASGGDDTNSWPASSLVVDNTEPDEPSVAAPSEPALREAGAEGSDGPAEPTGEMATDEMANTAPEPDDAPAATPDAGTPDTPTPDDAPPDTDTAADTTTAAATLATTPSHDSGGPGPGSRRQHQEPGQSGETRATSHPESTSQTRDGSAQSRARSYYQQGAKLLLSGNAAAAQKKFREALSAHSGYAPAYRGLGIAYERTGAAKQAVRSFRRYLRLSPRAQDAGTIRARIKRLGG